MWTNTQYLELVQLLQLRRLLLLLRLLLLRRAVARGRHGGGQHVGAADEAGGLLLGHGHVHGDAILGQELVEVHILQQDGCVKQGLTGGAPGG